MLIQNLISFAIISLSALDALKIKPRILNGFTSEKGQFPFYAFLDILLSDGSEAWCDGTLLNNEYVLTAAHCLRGANEIIVHLGSLETDNYGEKGRNVIVVKKENFIIHPKYFSLFFDQDIGLIRLPRPIEFTETIQPVKLPTSCESNINVKGIIIGNGSVKEKTDVLASILQWAPVKIIPFKICEELYLFVREAKTILCAINIDGRTIKKGDSGSPLIRESDGQLLGVANFQQPIEFDSTAPQGFNDFVKHSEWISSVTGIELPIC